MSRDDDVVRRSFALTTVRRPDGSTYRVRIIGPGEPVEHEGRFAALGYLGALLTRGLWTPRAPQRDWVVLTQRQRSAWRGFETVQASTFSSAREADRHASEVVDAMRSGRC